MTAEEQAVVLVNEVRAERQQEIWKGVGDRRGYGIVLEALCRAIEQHEAFKQEVSDAVFAYSNPYSSDEAKWEKLKSFIIPKPKPDPLVEVIKAMQAEPTTYVTSEVYANRINAALDALGFEIREKRK
jgi:regulator of protease activity HflC (stomatin/prohibitin superfamily)